MRVLFVGWHTFGDPNSRNATASAQMAKQLAELEHQVQVLTAGKLALPEKGLPQVAESLGISAAERFVQGSKLKAGTQWNLVEVGIICTGQPLLPEPDRTDCNAYLAHLQRVLREFRPNVTIVSGPENILQECARLAKKSGSKIITLIDNFGLEDRKFFSHSDRVLCFSQHLGNHYFHALGLRSYVTYPVLDEANSMVGEGDHDQIVVIPPAKPEELTPFLAILKELNSQKISVVLPRSSGEFKTILEENELTTIPFGTPSREYLASSRVVLDLRSGVPFNYEILDAHANGIPVVAVKNPASVEMQGSTNSAVLPEQICPAVLRHFTDFEFYSERVVAARANYEARFAPFLTQKRLEDYFLGLQSSTKVAPTIKLAAQ